MPTLVAASSAMPIEKKFVTMSVMAMVESSMATSTCWPSPNAGPG